MIRDTLERLLVTLHPQLVRTVEFEAGWLLRYEAVDDLVQDIQISALERGARIELRSDAEFAAWLKRVARTYLADRARHWSALKRRASALLRLTAAETPHHDGFSVPAPPSEATGPSTRAQQREHLTLAVKVLATLSERDQALVRLWSEGVDLAEQGESLSLSYDAAKRASARALERYRKAYRFASGI